MLYPALEYLVGLIRSGDNPDPKFVDIGPRRRLMILKGNCTEVEKEPAVLVRTLLSLESIAAVINHNSKSDVLSQSEVIGVVTAERLGVDQLPDTRVSLVTRAQVYVSEKGVVVILDDDDRTERAGMSFEYSKQYLALQKLQKPTGQKEFVRELRSTLYGCCSYAEIVNITRKIEFKRSSDGQRTVGHGVESLGRSVENVVRSSVGEIPEQLLFRVNLFAVPCDVNTLVTLEFALEIDVDHETLQLIPMGDAETRERARIISEIEHRLEALVPESALVVSGQLG